MIGLNWLPNHTDWRGALKSVTGSDDERKAELLSLARFNLDFIKTNSIDGLYSKLSDEARGKGFSTKPIRLAILGSCTLAQLHPAIRVAGLRREIAIAIYEADYGQYWQELTDTSSSLHEFKPDMILFALDGHHLAAGV